MLHHFCIQQPHDRFRHLSEFARQIKEAASPLVFFKWKLKASKKEKARTRGREEDDPHYMSALGWQNVLFFLFWHWVKTVFDCRLCRVVNNQQTLWNNHWGCCVYPLLSHWLESKCEKGPASKVNYCTLSVGLQPHRHLYAKSWSNL